MFFPYVSVANASSRLDLWEPMDSICLVAMITEALQQGHYKWFDHGMYPLVMTNIAIENGHRNSGFTH